jgi:hypothetical protein
VGPVALVGERRRGRPAVASQRRQDPDELAEQLGVAIGVQAEVLRGDVRVERIRPDAERQLALELRGGAGEDEVLALVGERPQLREQARLADARLAVDGQPPGTARLEVVERAGQLRELRVAPEKRSSAEVVRGGRPPTLRRRSGDLHLAHRDRVGAAGDEPGQ